MSIITKKNLRVVSALLELGADPKYLPNLCLSLSLSFSACFLVTSHSVTDPAIQGVTPLSFAINVMQSDKDVFTIHFIRTLSLFLALSLYVIVHIPSMLIACLR